MTGEGEVLDIQDLTPEQRAEPPPSGEVETLSLQLDERKRLRAVLNKHKGRKLEAATELGISRSLLWRKLYQFNLR